MKEDIKNSEDFLKSITGKNTGFSAPLNYFDNAEDRFSSFIFEESLSKQNSFKVPDNYFKNLENSILDKIVSEKRTPKVISLKSKNLKRISIAIAASIALLIGLTYVNNLNNTTEINFDAVAETDIENWMVDNFNELSDEDFANVLNNNIVNENDFAFTNIKDDAIEDYIISTENTSILNEID
ncbi:hypothetical protein JL193_01760 [Polaribacter batillariae]|uniref:Uncharacterized protein n=1 Tax=Polaribacter batillariae TaxID=2808900 RepID=A0ABX7SYH9_9FLAO|nr:hypothetical protein [Polaribacter batillariae]QTD38056.1 hypothetical protein JL193_01760 [Polaribacter batillariae]